ncbi:Cystatin-related plant, partial [Arabidopsis thaliana x Arabidopsis arenosa]
TKGDSSKLMETTEPTEDSALVATASQTTRKAESDPAEDIEESGDEVEESSDNEYVDSEEPVDEALAFALAFLAKRETDPAEEIEESDYEVDESGDEEEESDSEFSYSGETLIIKPKWWVEPEWDLDSFDCLEYDSSEEEDEMSNEEDEQKWRRFKRQLIESKGFYVEPELMPMYNYSRFKPVGDLERSAGHGQTYREFFAEMACLCLKTFNQYKGLNVEFVEVLRGAFTAGSKSKVYISFMAKEKPDWPLVEYQCKVCCTVVRNVNYPILCRPAHK